MLNIGGTTRIFLAAGGTDLRKSFEGLSGMVREQLKSDPLSGHLFLFCNPNRTRLKVLYWDGSGLWVCAKRLERGRFTWPERTDGTEAVVIRQAELAMLLGGLDLTQTREKRWWRREPAENAAMKS